MNYTPIIIIGSGRSGTNMFRDIISSIEGFKTWDCDEINPIWRYGNRDFPTDELPIEKITPKIKKYIRGRFVRLQKNTQANFIVEKTCANSLRLNYVYNIFPEAKYIIINRDGRDVTPSAMKRWGASFELNYTLKKMRYVPIKDLYYYISKFGFNRLKQMRKKNKALSFWGPLYQGYKQDVASKSLMEICANQWIHCAENTIRDRNMIPKENIFDIKYETFVENPLEEMKRFSNFLKLNITENELKKRVENVSNKSVGSHKKQINEDELELLNNITKPTLKKLGYID